jgi:hypothetical protein
VEKRFQLSEEHANRLNRLAQIHQIGEGEIVEKALNTLFALTDLLNEGAERQGWSVLSDVALQRVWDNQADSVCDAWRVLYADKLQSGVGNSREAFCR